MSGVGVEVDTGNFEAEVLQSDVPVLVDFWAEWCAPCRMVAPVVEEIAKERADSMKLAKLNVNLSPSLAAEYAVAAIPTLILFKSGRPVDRLVGALPKDRIAAWLDAHL